MTVRVWIVGEGNNELGSSDGHGGRGRGVLDALLQKTRSTGWECAGKVQWSAIPKYRAGGARHGADHGDYWNVVRLVLDAYESACEIAVFARDVDGDLGRETAVLAALRWVEDESGWLVDVVGGVAKPATEGWILALHGERDTDSMSRRQTLGALAARSIDQKSTAQYVEVVDAANLRGREAFGLLPGTESLQQWLRRADDVMSRLIDGV